MHKFYVATAEKILYFGFGLNRSEEFLKELLGRIPELHDSPSFLKDYELRIQRLEDLSAGPRIEIGESYGSDFQSYVVYKSPGKKVGGVTWSIKPEELKMLNDWELEGEWQTLTDVKVSGRGGEYLAMTHICKYDKGILVPDSINYPDFIVDKKRITDSALECIFWGKFI